MAIGTAAAIGLGVGVLGAGASALSASKNSKAINKATDAQTESNAASIALQREVYGQNKETLSPFVARGNAAGETMNALLGLGGAMQPINGQQPIAGGQNQAQRGGPGAANYYGFGDGSIFSGDYNEPNFPARLGVGNFNIPINAYQSLPNAVPNQAAQTSGVQPTIAGNEGMTPQEAANDAFDIFRGSTGYQFRVNEGMDALNSGYAGSGMLQSGAALKALDDYRQNMASAEFGNYMGMLGNQQGVGLSAAGAQAGVGVDYANNVSNLNAQNANALANAAVAKANNSNALIGGIAGSIGNVLGGFGR